MFVHSRALMLGELHNDLNLQSQAIWYSFYTSEMFIFRVIHNICTFLGSGVA